MSNCLFLTVAQADSDSSSDSESEPQKRLSVVLSTHQKLRKRAMQQEKELNQALSAEGTAQVHLKVNCGQMIRLKSYTSSSVSKIN